MAKYMYIFQGGGYVTASTSEEFVTNMRNSSRSSEASLQDYMVAVSDRCMVDSRKYVRTTSYDDFLQDLITFEYVVQINTN
jgi:hypothetical protein